MTDRRFDTFRDCARAALAGLALAVVAWPAAHGQSPANHPAQNSQSPAQSVARGASAASAPAVEPACTHCRERLKTIAELEQKLPADWTLRTERENVFGSDILVVQAGLTNTQTLVLVHGLGQNGFTDWLPVMPALARRYHVLALDLPGFGYSAAPQGKYSPTNYARVVQALIARHAKGAPIVVGHSMGGAVALRLASNHPQSVSKLILVDAAGILHRTAFAKDASRSPLSTANVPEFLKEKVARITELGYATVERIFGLPDDPLRLLRQSDPAWEFLLRGRADMNAALALVDEDFSGAVHTLTQPVHVVWGDADAVAPLRTGRLLARRLPRAQLHTLAGVGHTPMLDATERFIAALSTALASEPAPGAAPVRGALEPGDLECKGRVDAQYSGHYREVRIDGCVATRLTDVSAERIVVRDSSVQMNNVQVRSSGVALDAVDSHVIATASDFSGETAVRADASRIDLAGVYLLALGNAVIVQRRSRLIGSINRIQSPNYTGYWHDDTELEDATLRPVQSTPGGGEPPPARD